MLAVDAMLLWQQIRRTQRGNNKPIDNDRRLVD